jgi:rRNA maturation protein Nop10
VNARLIKIQNRIKHMEFNIDQNRKRGEALSRDCYALSQSTELLAFDFIFSSYLMGNCPSQEVYGFLNQCIHPGYDLSSSNPADFAKAAEHIQFLQYPLKRLTKFQFF